MGGRARQAVYNSYFYTVNLIEKSMRILFSREQSIFLEGHEQLRFELLNSFEYYFKKFMKNKWNWFDEI